MGKTGYQKKKTEKTRKVIRSRENKTHPRGETGRRGGSEGVEAGIHLTVNHRGERRLQHPAKGHRKEKQTRGKKLRAKGDNQLWGCKHEKFEKPEP